MSEVERYLTEQRSKYSSGQRELLWPVLGCIVLGLLLGALPFIVAQNRIARDFKFDRELGKPTMGRLYLNPSSYLTWKVRCRAFTHPGVPEAYRFPACQDPAQRELVRKQLNKYDGPTYLWAMGLFGCSIALGIAWRNRRRDQNRVQTHGDAKWATFEELVKANFILSKRKTLATDKGKIGFPLGVFLHNKKRYYVYTNPQEALGVMLIGPPGSGKTSCFYIPHLLTDASSKFV